MYNRRKEVSIKKFQKFQFFLKKVFHSSVRDLDDLPGVVDGINIVILNQGLYYPLDLVLPGGVQGRVCNSVLGDLELAAAGSDEHTCTAALMEGSAGDLLSYLGDACVEDLVEDLRGHVDKIYDNAVVHVELHYG